MSNRDFITAALFVGLVAFVGFVGFVIALFWLAGAI